MRKQIIEEVARPLYVDPSLSNWEEPLRTWFALLDRFDPGVNPKGTDALAAYWYNERATLSSLAGALWQNPKSKVLEEYTTYRSDGGVERYGRADLWWSLADQVEYVIEAKQFWPLTTKSLTEKASLYLDVAESQCQADRYGGDNRLAIVFCAPSLFEKPDKEEIAEWTEAAASIEADMKAIYLNTNAPQSPMNNRFYPGVILLGKKVAI